MTPVENPAKFPQFAGNLVLRRPGDAVSSLPVARVVLRTTDRQAADALAAALQPTECVTDRVDGKTLLVGVPRQLDDGQLLVELRFFVNAWLLKHQDASVAFSLAA